MGIAGGSSSPLLHALQDNVCDHPLAQKWLVDLDEVVLGGIHLVLGELMIKHRINLMPYWKMLRTNLIESVAIRFQLFEVDYCQLTVMLPVRIICVVAMLVTNAYMIASFLRGIQESGSVGGTSLSTAANFASSAMYGKILWDELMNGLWFLGFSLVLVGVVILSSETTTTKKITTTNGDIYNATSAKTNSKIRERLKKLQQRVAEASSPRRKNPLSLSPLPPPPTEIYTKTMNLPKISNNKSVFTKGKVASLRASLDRPKSPTIISSYSKTSARRVTPSPPEQGRDSFRFKQAAPVKSSSPMRTPASPARKMKAKAEMKPESSLKKFYNFNNKSLLSPPYLVNRSFVNECALCEGALFYKTTGDSTDAIADLSLKTCFHLFHAKCLKQASKMHGNACPICEKPLSMWTASKQAAQFPGFWLERVENYLKSMKGAPQDSVKDKDICLPASKIRDYFQQDDSLTKGQKLYIEDDPTGMDKGLQAALEWGGHIDCNQVPKGHVGFSKALRTRGIWKYDSKKDDVWFWDWGPIHPRQRCDQCQLIKRPLPVECEGCQGSSEAAFYCSVSCSKRDKQRHKQTCDSWKAHGPKNTTQCRILGM